MTFQSAYGILKTMRTTFRWNGAGLEISQCNYINTDKTKCEKCKYRFQCFTDRAKRNFHVIKTMDSSSLTDVMKQIDELEFEVDCEN